MYVNVYVYIKIGFDHISKHLDVCQNSPLCVLTHFSVFGDVVKRGTR